MAATRFNSRRLILSGVLSLFLVFCFWLIVDLRSEERIGERKVQEKSVFMTDSQCEKSFPGLFEEIDKAVQRRKGKKIVPEELVNGEIRGYVYDQQIYITFGKVKDYTSRPLAVLLALHRAVITSPDPLPNFHFALDSGDRAPSKEVLWSLAYNLADTATQLWPMVDFGFWSWPEPHVEGYNTVKLRADSVDKRYNYQVADKIPKAVWRGASLGGNEVRAKLMEVSKGKPWADIELLDWGDKSVIQKKLFSMSDHCKYQYLIHTEGNTYSGRLKYLFQCNSVVIIHKMSWQQHFHPLLKHEGPDQNYVLVERDWSDLEKKIMELNADPRLREKIARNGKRFANLYLGPAAQNCYWRRHLRSWAATLDEKADWQYLDEDGMPKGTDLESFALMRRVEWTPK
ncbi:glycosyl transferase family 90-domain-containing protein [Gaertneriomyces semiglobifer]|nr:glycosyl transferase family 90-domain-containing protein [Gaertneriomyces semiglobifer]